MTEETPVVPDWMYEVVQANRTNGGTRVHWTIEPDDAAPSGHGFSCTVSALGAEPAHVSLAALPPDTAVQVALRSVANWVLEDVREDSTVRVIRNDLGPNRRPLLIAGSVHGTVRLTGPDAHVAPVEMSSECPAKAVIVEAGTHDFQSSRSKSVVRVEGGRFVGTFNELHLDGDAIVGIDGSNQHHTTINDLHIHGKRVVTVRHGQTGCTIGTLMGLDRADDSVRFEMGTPQQPGRPTLNLTTVRDLKLGADWDITILLNAAANVDFGGGIQLVVRVDADNVVFGTPDRPVNLKTGVHAVLSNISGYLNISTIASAHLEAAPGKSFHILRTENEDAPFEGTYLRGFTIPEGMEGRRLAGQFTDAHVIEPHTDALPGNNYKARLWPPTLGTPTTAERFSPPLRHNAELLRQLHELTKTKGASGAVRTRVGWCAQRLRHLTTRTRTERTALSVYRTLGYGERPMPALATWAVMSVLFAILHIAWTHHTGWRLPNPCHLSTPHLHLYDVFKDSLKQAISPVSGVLGGGAITLGSPLAYVARALLAVPLVTGLLSLRHYVRTSG